MGQSRKGSLVESLVNVVAGFGLSMITNILLMAAYGFHVTLHQQVQLTAIFTVMSIGRSFVLRRIFNWITARREQNS